MLDAVEQRGYVPNLLAQGLLRRRRSPVIGLCIPDATATYFTALSERFETIATAGGYEIMQVFSHHDPASELRKVKTLHKYKIGGLLLFPSRNPGQTLDFIVAAGTPAVILDRPIEDRRLDQVTVDAMGAMHDVMAGLVARGHRRILFLTRDLALLVNKHRMAGVELAIREAGEPVELKTVVRADEDGALAAQLTAIMAVADAPTALIVSNSSAALRILKALRRLGIRCPEQISLIAVDEPSWADLVEPRLSVIRQPTRDVAHYAMDMLMRRIDGETAPPSRVVLQAEVSFTGSVADLTVGSDQRAAARRKR